MPRRYYFIYVQLRGGKEHGRSNTHTIMPQGGAWGGTALGAGVGGLLGSWLGNGGFGGLGYRGAAAGVGYDTGAINGIQASVNGIQQQIANADRDLLIQTSGQNQFVGNLINQTGDAIVGAVNAGTLAQTQNQGAGTRKPAAGLLLPGAPRDRAGRLR